MNIKDLSDKEQRIFLSELKQEYTQFDRQMINLGKRIENERHNYNKTKLVKNGKEKFYHDKAVEKDRQELLVNPNRDKEEFHKLFGEETPYYDNKVKPEEPEIYKTLTYSLLSKYKVRGNEIEQQMISNMVNSNNMGYKPTFITITLPSMYHPFKTTKNGDRHTDIKHWELNPNFAFDTLEEAYSEGLKLLYIIWNDILHKISFNAREMRGNPFLYDVITEQHKSGVFHLHGLLNVPEKSLPLVEKTMEKMVKRFGLSQVDVVNKFEDSNHAINYMLKYIRKTIIAEFTELNLTEFEAVDYDYSNDFIYKQYGLSKYLGMQIHKGNRSKLPLEVYRLIYGGFQFNVDLKDRLVEQAIKNKSCLMYEISKLTYINKMTKYEDIEKPKFRICNESFNCVKPHIKMNTKLGYTITRKIFNDNIKSSPVEVSYEAPEVKFEEYGEYFDLIIHDKPDLEGMLFEVNMAVSKTNKKRLPKSMFFKSSNDNEYILEDISRKKYETVGKPYIKKILSHRSKIYNYVNKLKREMNVFTDEINSHNSKISFVNHELSKIDLSNSFINEFSGENYIYEGSYTKEYLIDYKQYFVNRINELTLEITNREEEINTLENPVRKSEIEEELQKVEQKIKQKESRERSLITKKSILQESLIDCDNKELVIEEINKIDHELLNIEIYSHHTGSIYSEKDLLETELSEYNYGLLIQKDKLLKTIESMVSGEMDGIVKDKRIVIKDLYKELTKLTDEINKIKRTFSVSYKKVRRTVHSSSNELLYDSQWYV